MDPLEKHKICERRMASEAENLGQVIEQLGDFIPLELIDENARKRIISQTANLPSTLAVFPFGFELGMDKPQKGADLGVTVVGGDTRTADYFRNQGNCSGATPSLSGFAELLSEIDGTNSILSGIMSRNFMLEFDLASARGIACPPPGLCMRPHENMRNQEHRLADEVSAIANAMVNAVGWQFDLEDQCIVKKVCTALEPHMSLETLAVFPGRRKFIRMATAGYRSCDEVVNYLDRIGLNRQNRLHVEPLLAALERRVSIPLLGLSLDIESGTFGNTLGISLYLNTQPPAASGFWINSPTLWDEALESLNAHDYGISEKLSALKRFQGPPRMLLGKSGNLLLIRGINHLKLTLCGDRIDGLKAYIYFLLCPWPECLQPSE